MFNKLSISQRRCLDAERVHASPDQAMNIFAKGFHVTQEVPAQRWRFASRRSPIPLFWHNQSIQLARDDSAELMVQALPGTGLPMLWTPSQRVGGEEDKASISEETSKFGQSLKADPPSPQFPTDCPIDAIFERNILEFLDHPCIVSIAGSFETSNHLMIAMEFLPGGDYGTMLNMATALDTNSARFYISEAIAGVSYLHAHGIVHRDLKPENLLISRDRSSF
ncbi:MAST4 [Cordylochernes scorpioides]|uniref:Serine/threonine-protein kinase greatwall n=1 Tax=Cordylochernes scorpioides TaxID=51811 RepID=A0ABY6KGV1_9ARAC|nr:MAST4 [Cordylochernes scorpioides]